MNPRCRVTLWFLAAGAALVLLVAFLGAYPSRISSFGNFGLQQDAAAATSLAVPKQAFVAADTQQDSGVADPQPIEAPQAPDIAGGDVGGADAGTDVAGAVRQGADAASGAGISRGSAELVNRATTSYTPSAVKSEGKDTVSVSSTGDGSKGAWRAKYGFYLHVFENPAAVIDQVRTLKTVFPGSPIYIMSDGGFNFSRLCEEEGCTFVLCPPANDRWHPWPFLHRLYEAAVSLQAEYVIMLEPDNSLHGPIKHPPTHDAGGINSKGRTFALAKYVENLAHARRPNYTWTRESMATGLAGGSYFKTEMILDAFSDEAVARIDWNYLAEKAGKKIYSSDFAMPYVLAARGWEVMPWLEVAQMEKDPDIPFTGAVDAAFRHYSRGFPGGKPPYRIPLKGADHHLFEMQLPEHKRYNSVCQVCYDLAKYIKRWGSTRCTNSHEFNYSEKMRAAYPTR